MVRFFAFVFVATVALACIAVGAPVPKDAKDRDAVIKQFGTQNDPSKEAEFASDGGKLLIKLPKPAGPTRVGAFPFPHTLRTVSGDFEVGVKVSYPLPEKVPQVGGGAMCAVGGLLIWDSDNNNVLFHRHHQPCGLADGTTRWDVAYCTEYNRPKNDSLHHGNIGGMKEAPPVYLRLTRKKGVVTPAYSYDGKEWKAMQSGAMEFPEKVSVGVYAYRTAGEATAVTFEGFTVTPIEDEKK